MSELLHQYNQLIYSIEPLFLGAAVITTHVLLIQAIALAFLMLLIKGLRRLIGDNATAWFFIVLIVSGMVFVNIKAFT